MRPLLAALIFAHRQTERPTERHCEAIWRLSLPKRTRLKTLTVTNRGKERPGRDADPSPPFSAVVMKE